MPSWVVDDPLATSTVVLAVATFILAVATVLMAAWTRRSAQASEESAKASADVAASSIKQLELLTQQHHLAYTPSTLSLRVLILDLDLYPKPEEWSTLSHAEIWKEIDSAGKDPVEILDVLVRQQIETDTSSEPHELESELTVLDRFMSSTHARDPRNRFVILVGNPTPHAALSIVTAIYDPRHSQFGVCTFNYEYLGHNERAYFPIHRLVSATRLHAVVSKAFGEPSSESFADFEAVDDWAVLVWFRVASGRSYLVIRRYAFHAEEGSFTIEPLDFLSLTPWSK